MKHSKVSAIFKTPSERKVENYRTIYVVSATSKSFEGTMFNRRYAFLKNENVLYKTKFGFQPKPSTIDALFQITESNRFVQKKINGCILLDIEKAFDITHQS